MRIVIDARFWGPTHTGLGVYTRELVTALSKVDKQNDYTLLVRQTAIEKVRLPKNFRLKIVDIPAYSLAEQLILPVILYQLHPDLVHFTSSNLPVLYWRSFIVTVHDLIKNQSRGTATTTRQPVIYWLKYVLYLVVTYWAVKMSKKVLVPSQAICDELSHVYRLPREKVIVTNEAAVITPDLLRAKAEIRLPQKFAIYTGNAYPHKNLDQLLSVWSEVYAKTYLHLVLATGRTVFSTRIAKLIDKYQISEIVHFEGYLTDEQLAQVYSKASLYVFPSLLEGFGLPGLDAMNFDLPVVCSDIPVLREIYGPAAVYFNPKDQNDMVEKITRATLDPKLRQGIVTAGRNQVRKYSWARMARETLAVYESCFSL